MGDLAAFTSGTHEPHVEGFMMSPYLPGNVLPAGPKVLQSCQPHHEVQKPAVVTSAAVMTR